MDDYHRIARIIAYLEAHRSEQPDLETLAREVELSPHHFHRLFSRWAGVTPKDFLQCLTVEHAKERLRLGASVLEAAIDAGLSGPGRLHDLCVGLEAASPGEMKSGGRGWTIRFGMAESPFGRCLIAENPRGLCALFFVENENEAESIDEMRRDWPHADWQRDDAVAHAWVRRIFHPESNEATTPLRAFVRGTEFQVRVWRALLRIPSGTLVTYGQLAKSVGQPGASRAVGSAVGANPISYLIPCHRVIRGTGVIGEYRWGHLRKRAILAKEAKR